MLNNLYASLPVLLCAGTLSACATPPPGDALIGGDFAALTAAYGPPAFRGPAPDGAPGAERVVFVRTGHVPPSTGLERGLRRCDRLGVAAGVEALNPTCEDQPDWTASGESIPVTCTLRFSLGADGRVSEFVGEPAGCDAHLTPR